jgi:hypothetical protein
MRKKKEGCLNYVALIEPQQTLRDYYQHAELELAEPFNPFHQYRVELPNHHFLILKDKIRNTEDLRKWIVRLCPIHVYATANAWLNPQSLSYMEFNGRKAGYNYAQNVLLNDGILAFDTDFHARPYQEAKDDALAIQDYMHECGYRVDYVAFSGGGFQLKIYEHDLHLARSYSSRNMSAVFRMYRELRVPFIEELERRGVQIDKEITLDSRRILRVVGTVNSKNGYVCTSIRDLDGFELADVERLNLGGIAPATENVGMTNFFLNDKDADDSLWGKSGRTSRTRTKPNEVNPTQSAPQPTIYLGSPTIGTVDRQIVMLRFKSDVNLTQLKEHLSRFAAQEQLAPFLIFKSTKDPEGLWCISPSAIQTAGMKRLLRRFSRDSTVYVKFHRRIVPLPLQYVAQSSGVVDSEIPVSRAHLKYFSHYNLVDWSPRISCGSENLLPLPIGEMR